MKLYSGIDLHSSNSYLAIVDETGKRIFKEKAPNDIRAIVHSFEPFRDNLAGIVVESTYNWYWLVDGLMAEGFALYLANPSAIQKYSGMKYADDKHDAFWLAEMLRLNILPTGYIYPKDRVKPVPYSTRWVSPGWGGSQAAKGNISISARFSCARSRS
jgi:transposase